MADIEGLKKKYESIEGERFFQELWNNNEYQPVLDEKADVIVDVGALAGEFSSLVYDRAGTIYAIEPQKDHYLELDNNIKEFGLNKIKPFNIALSGKNETRTLHTSVRGGHTLMTESNAIGGEQVETKTLATFMSENNIEHIDILKIDVEDAEKEIFRADDFPSVADKISIIIGEHLTDVAQILKNLGFEETVYAVNSVYKRP